MTSATVIRVGSSQSGAGTFIFVPAAGSVAVGKTLQFTAYRAFTPSAGKNGGAINSHVRLASSDANVATITNTGLVTAVGLGTVTITAASPTATGTPHGLGTSTIARAVAAAREPPGPRLRS